MAAEQIESLEDFESTPEGQYKRWNDEITASQKMLDKWQKSGRDVVKRYTDDRSANQENDVRLNLFWSNVSTYKSMLFGSLPKIDVSRTYADPNDDVGRIASEIMQRVLTLDVEENGAEYSSVLKSVLEDRLLPGLGCARVRYEHESESQEIEAQIDPQSGAELAPAYSKDVTTYESAEVDYYFWEDISWSWTRNWKELRWVAFRNYLTKDEVKARFGEEIARDISMKTVKPNAEKSSKDDDNDIWQKAEIWEIWDKTKQEQVFYSDGLDKVIETNPDPLKLKGFFPCPPFLLATTTTTSMVPKPDYCFAQDQYDAIDDLEARITKLTDAVRVVGFYDQSNKEIGRALDEGIENKMVPVEQWAMLAEKGGIGKQIEWFPLEQVVGAITELTQQRDDKIALLYNVVGMADIMRGQTQGDSGRVTGQEQELAAKFGSVRVQALQEEMARFATDMMQLKCEVIARHFDPANILKLSNMKYAMEQQVQVMQAVQLIKNPDEFYLRVIIRPESVAMVDYAQIQSERSTFIQNISVYAQSMGPMIEKAPETLPLWMSMLKWAVAGFKGADEIEGIMDKAIDQMTQKVAQDAANPKPDPEAQAAQAAMQLQQAKSQAEMQKIQTQHQNDMQAQQQEFAITMKEMMQKLQDSMQLIQAKFGADMKLEQIQAQGDVVSTQSNQQADIASTSVEHTADMALEQQEHRDEMELAVTQHAADMSLLDKQKEVHRAQMDSRPRESE